jgi:hypothetical protein
MALNQEQRQGLIDSILSILTKNMSKIIFAIICIFLGIIISWKAERGACLINCNFTDNSKQYFFREKDINQKDIIDMIKKE